MPGNKNISTFVSPKLVQFAADPAARDLVAASPDAKTCARMLKILGAGSFTSALGAGDVIHSATLGPLAAGDTLEGEFSSVISADQAFIAFY
jgi:hypothetical protein